MSAGDDGNEILQLTQEALDLAHTACHFDREENYVGAYDYYDKSILNIDEVIGKLPPHSVQWRKLMEIRGQYDDRMDQLKEMETQRGLLTASFSFGGINNSNNSAGTSGNTGGGARSFISSAGSSKNSNSKKKKLTDAEEFQFQEIAIFNEFKYEEPPKNILEIPYWQLRNISKSIETGAFFTKSLFIAKNVWNQSEVKFSGFNAKSAAFEIVINLITNDIEILYRLHDEDSLIFAENAFYTVEDELSSLRNQLAKSFPYIKELSNSGNHGAIADDSSSHLSNTTSSSGTNSTINSNTNNNSIQETPTASASPGPAESTTGLQGTNNLEVAAAPAATTPSTASKHNKSLTHMMSAFGKSMKKYAEVGLHRLAVALPSRISSEDLAEYKNKIQKLAEKSQIFVSWIRYIDGLKAGILVKDAHLFPSSVELMDESGVIPDQAVNLPPFLQEKAVAIGQSLVNITNAIRDIVCEILLRDVEYLLDRYLHHTRKAYTRMHWDQDFSNSGDA